MASPRGEANGAEFSPRFPGPGGDALPQDVAAYLETDPEETLPAPSAGPRPPSHDSEITDLAPPDSEKSAPAPPIESTQFAEEYDHAPAVDPITPRSLEHHGPSIPEVLPVLQSEETERDAAMTPRTPIETTEWHSASVRGMTGPVPASIGRYQVLGILGSGGFGRVFLARDEILYRQVAVKVPHPSRVAEPKDVELYLDEARALARLDHPHIVPVYDVGRTDDGLCFVVSKVIEGISLSADLGRPASEFVRVAELTASVAEALHHAHQKGLVHRDVKPSNILLDRERSPYLADFGLALKEEDFGKGAAYAGTPAYMSPEQASGEGHRVDRRTDVFSLGVILYELLTGRHPFGTGERRVIMERIATFDARPPRQLVDAIPAELERINLRALERWASDRYGTAQEFAEDLRWFVEQSRAGEPSSLAPPPTDPRRLSVISGFEPKGLRSFEKDDAEAFLEFLPGPRDRQGLAEAIRFWKARVEETSAREAFPVGLIYGPSGCGKSSLVKAGLIPRLAPRVLPVYLEATGEDLEARLLARLRRDVPELDAGLPLAEALAAIRRSTPASPDSKVLIVLDQFEQWLHANREQQETELARALRQCDGIRLQAIVLIRDDFWMATSRFMKELEVRIEEGRNAAPVDRFHLPHAHKVLATLGAAFGALPTDVDALSADQARFLDDAVAALAKDGKVIPVRLALFAEMIKGKPWVPETLERLGGAVGAGTTFLEETFSATTAPPEHRLHEEAARAVLATLLPGPGAEIKGHRRSRAELLEASGYADTPEDFRALMRILDGRTRLLTPIAPEGQDHDSGSSTTTPDAERFYQLTHDYLVPSIREWLTRKQHETRRGRAELRLSERAALWGAKPEPKQLPSLLEWLNILLVTSRPKWTAAERRLMRAAGKRHLAHTAVALAVLLVLGVAAQRYRERSARDRKATHAKELVQRLRVANIDQVHDIIDEINDERASVDPLLREAVRSSESNPSSNLHVRLALLPVDERQVVPLYERLMSADPEPFRVILKELRPYWPILSTRLWDELEPSAVEPKRRFRAAVALANYAPESNRWDERISEVTEQLLAQPSLHIPGWVDALRPLKDRLIPSLYAFYSDHDPSHEIARKVADQILADYASDRPDQLADVLAESHPDAFLMLFDKLRPHGAKAISALESAFDRATAQGRADTSDSEASRAANLAIALFRMGKPERLWPLLKASPTPRIRSFLIDRLAPMGGDPQPLVERALTEPDDSIRAALLLSLGEFNRQSFPTALRQRLDGAIPMLFRNHRDAAVHAASGRLLRIWKEHAKVREIEYVLGSGHPERGRRWYINRLGQTFVVISGPVEFLMGSRPDGFEAETRNTNEGPQNVRIPRGFDIAATEVTISQFLPFLDREPALRESYSRSLGTTHDRPITNASWYDAAKYCNWLSQKEGIPADQWCYEPNDQGGFGPGMRLAPGYLKRTGYRLPTEAEWEYACRAGSITSRCYGDSDELLTRYAHCSQFSLTPPLPIGSLLPNAFGLFDMHGNVGEWCQEDVNHHSMDPPKGDWEDVEGTLNVGELPVRTGRGGGLHQNPRAIRSAHRFGDAPSLRNRTGGFRVVRSHRP